MVEKVWDGRAKDCNPVLNIIVLSFSQTQGNNWADSVTLHQYYSSSESVEKPRHSISAFIENTLYVNICHLGFIMWWVRVTNQRISILDANGTRYWWKESEELYAISDDSFEPSNKFMITHKMFTDLSESLPYQDYQH